jgi:transcriptional regulator with XRE-family HTH domain
MRESFDMTQQEVANELNKLDPGDGLFDKTAVSKWESGKHAIPDRVIKDLEKIFDCPASLKATVHADRFPEDKANARSYDATLHMFYPAMLSCDIECPQDVAIPDGRFGYVSPKRMRDFDRQRTVYFFEFRAVVLHETIALPDATLAEIVTARRLAKEAARQMLHTGLHEYCNVAPDLVKTVPFALSLVELRVDRPADELSRTLQLLAAPSLVALLMQDPTWGSDRERAIINDSSTTTGMHPFNIAGVQTGWATEEGLAFHQTGADRKFSDTAVDLMIQLQALRRYASFVADKTTRPKPEFGPDFLDEAADGLAHPDLGEDLFRERQLVRAISNAFSIRESVREAISELNEPYG